jgi:RNA polymerase sigma-70 factor
MNNHDDPRLRIHLLRLSQDDKKAMSYFYIRYASRIRGFAAQLLQNEDDASDMVQDVLLKLWEERHSLGDIVSLDAYIFRMTKNLVLNTLRRRQILTSYISSEQRTNSFVSSDADSTEELYSLIEKAIDTMPEPRRRIFCMSRFEHKKHAEIAALLNLSPRAVQYHICAALDFLRKYAVTNDLGITIIPFAIGFISVLVNP